MHKYVKSMLVGFIASSMLATGCSKNTANLNQAAAEQVQDSTESEGQTESDSNKTEANNSDSGDETTTENNSTEATTTAVPDLKEYLSAKGVAYTEEDSYTVYEKTSATTIALEGTSATVNGTGVNVIDGVVTITQSGTYVITGELTDGQIFVEEENNGLVRLVLNGVAIHSSMSAPIYIKNAGKTIISLEAGTQNILTDGTRYVYTNAADEEPNAALYSKDSLTINGTGSLVVESNFKNGIMAKDVLKIMSGTIDVNAVNNGIVGRDALIIQTADISVTSGGDGLKTSNDTDATKALLMIEDGTINITSGEDAIQSETAMIVKRGNFNLVSGGGSTQILNDDVSTKGIKTRTILSIDNGSFTIDSSDDSLHSNGNIMINGGIFKLTSYDDGIHADAQLDLKAGEITVTKSYEGIEALTMNLAGANINVVASDDGINVAGGQDSSSTDKRTRMNQFSVGTGMLTIQGGVIYVDSDGDGIDVNGSALMTGGEVYVSGPTNDGNAAFDYDGSFTVRGGILYAIGSSGMAQSPTTDSSQCAILVNTDTIYQANAKITIEDMDGNVVGEFTVKKVFNSIVFTSPDLTLNESYIVRVDGVEVATLELTQMVTTSGKVGMGGLGGGNPGNFRGDNPDGFNGERPDGFSGERPDGFSGGRPDGFNGDRPDFNGEVADDSDGETTDN